MKDIKIMCLGGCCATIYTLGNFRIPGPVDNVHSLKGLATIDVIFNHNLEEEFLSGNYTRTKLNRKVIDNDNLDPNNHFCEYESIFKHYRMNHNDIESEGTQIELKKRIDRIYDFLDSIKTKSNYLAYALCPYDFNKDKTFNQEQFEKGLAILEENGLLEKTIFIGTKYLGTEPSWYNFNSDFARNLDNYVEVSILSKGDINKIKETRLNAQKVFKDFLIKKGIL